MYKVVRARRVMQMAKFATVEDFIKTYTTWLNTEEEVNAQGDVSIPCSAILSPETMAQVLGWLSELILRREADKLAKAELDGLLEEVRK